MQTKKENGAVDENKSLYSFVEPMSKYLGMEANITEIKGESYSIDLDRNRHYWYDWMFDDSYNPEKSILSEEMIKDIADVVKKHNLGVSISENEGKLIIEPLEVEKEEELEKGTYVMVTNDINNEFWTLRQYLCDGYCDTYRTESFNIPPMKFKYIIEFSKFNPNDIEESLKYNIVK